MDLQEYNKLLKEHDLTYIYTDDYKKYQKGLANERKLILISQTSNEHAELLSRWQEWFDLRLQGINVAYPEVDNHSQEG